MYDVLDSLRDNLASRYDIERQIGAGGMARVYLAVEHHPHRRVAIKVLDPEVSTRLLRERFIREVDLSSKLNHPHIMPIFSAGEAGGLFYYVMPYVEGESLRHRLHRERALALDDALHVARDVADALGFAHAQGIIHRDIKPENILLSGDHAIVADFGIARAISAAGVLTLTLAGQSVGSPGYMSPEQAAGSAQLDARTDVYSLGCVLFEMLAGEPPLPSMTERLVHNWKALDGRPALRDADAQVVRAVKHAISRALAPLPDDRFPTAAEFAAALGGPTHRISVPTRGIFAGRRGRRLAIGAAALAVLALGAAAVVSLRGPESGLNDRRVVVAVIENRTGDPALDNLGHMTADWVTQGLAQTGVVEVVPSMSVMSSSLTPGEHGPGRLDAAALRALGRETGAGTVVSGAYYRQADSVRFQLQISAARDGKVLRALDPVAGPLAQPLMAVETVRQRVMAALATLFDSRLSYWATTAGQPPSYEAYQEFIEGLDRFVKFDWRGAVDHFERSAAGDSTFRMPLIFAATALMNLGEYAVAESLAHVVERSPGHLAPLDRLYLTWVLAQTRGDHQKALETSRQMAVLAPESETLFLVAGDAIGLNRPREAIAALTALGPDRGFAHGWSVYWTDLAFARHLLGEHRRELKDAVDGRRRFPDQLDLVAAEVRALAALGRTADVERGLSEAANFPPQRGWTPADVGLIAGLELRVHGHPTESAAALGRAVSWLESQPAREAQSVVHRYRLAIAYVALGRLDDARRVLERLAAATRPGSERSPAVPWTAAMVGDFPDHLNFTGLLGTIAAIQGSREAALQTERTLQATDRPYLFGRHTMWRARIHALLGEREAAMGLLREAISQGYPHALALHTDLAFESLRDYAPFQELLRPRE